MTTMDIIKELTDELAIKNVYQSLKEQQMQPEYSNLEFEKRVQLLLESESFERKNKKIKRLLNEAKLPDKTASIEDINFSIANRVLDKSLILELASLKFIENSNNIIFTGFTRNGQILPCTSTSCFFSSGEIRQSDRLLSVDAFKLIIAVSLMERWLVTEN
jgi:DNA replication protein DnaC